MNGISRIDMADASVALAPACSCAYFWLFFGYFSSRPTQLDVVHGYLHALNNHGSYVYVSNADATGLSLLEVAGCVGFFAALAILRIGRVNEAFFRIYNTRRKIVSLCAFLFWLAIIYCVGPFVVRLALHSGIVLNF